jgi:hypothetical protein
MTKEQREELGLEIQEFVDEYRRIDAIYDNDMAESGVPSPYEIMIEVILDTFESEVEKAKKEEFEHLLNKYGDSWFIDMDDNDIEEEKWALEK